MCILVLITGVFGSRVAFALTWIFTDRVQAAFAGGWLLPAVGLVLAPWTALAYVLAWSPTAGVSNAGWLLVFAAFVLDVVTYTGRAVEKNYKKRYGN